MSRRFPLKDYRLSHQFIELAIDGCLDGLGCTQTLDV
jgi:hypothetical protein